LSLKQITIANMSDEINDEQNETDVVPTPPTMEPTEGGPVDPKLAMAGQLIDEAVGMLQQALRLVGQVPGASSSSPNKAPILPPEEDEDARIIEGVFDGQKMIGPDGRHYSVPANYASKSKLVEGDMLKLTITGKGAFVYKQVGPSPRRRLLGELIRNTAGSDFAVKVGTQKYRVLTASVTYYRGKEGDEVTILVPDSGQSVWAAVENIIKKTGAGGTTEEIYSPSLDPNIDLGVE
jgi:hypothetical protein